MSDPERGAVFTATGKAHYHDLAIKAARSLRAHEPGLAIDLFSDRQIDDPVFDRVIVDETVRRYSKIDALLRSRFRDTLYLDSDVVVVAPLGDVFDLLARFDMAAAQDQFLANHYCARTWRQEIPAAFPQVNSGVMAWRLTPKTRAFLESWKAAVAEHGIGRDQPALRELLWLGDLRMAILPPEYNMMNLDAVRSKALDAQQAAPRVIHNPHFYQHYDQFRDSPDPVADSLGLIGAARLKSLLEQDRTLRPGSPPGRNATRGERARIWLGNLGWMLPRLPRYLKFNLGYQSRRLSGFLRRLGAARPTPKGDSD
ncbi:MAG: putative nucleotide-diphospho-sugar transferase [Pseudooceanicola nanhaiensis]